MSGEEEDFHCTISSFMAETQRVLFAARFELRSVTDRMRRDVAVAYERLQTLEVECLKEAGPLRHLVLELENQAECLTLIFEDLVHGERRVRSRLFELSSELYDLQNSRSGPFELDAQQRVIGIRVASINILRDRIHALETNDEFSELLQTLDENGKILQTGCDVRRISEIRDRISHVRQAHAISVKRLMHAWNRKHSDHASEMAQLHQTISDKRGHVHFLQQSIHVLFQGAVGDNLLDLVQEVSTYARNIARTRDMFRVYDANAGRIVRLEARQSELEAAMTTRGVKNNNAFRMGDSFPAV